MLKYLSYIFVFLFAASVAACGGSSSTAATAVYDLPPVFASYSASGPHLMGGAVQGGSIAAKFSNYSVSTFAGTSGSAGFINYSTSNEPPAQFNHPADITTNGINFYVTDYLNNLIRQITPAGIVTTLQCIDADTGAAISFYRPSGITSDGTNLYVVNSGGNTVRFIEIATGKTTTIGSISSLTGSVDSTVKTDVRFNQPTGITTDGDNVYVTDSGNHTVRRINIASKAVSTMAGTSGQIGSNDGTQGSARFNLPGRITTDGQNLYLTDFYNRTIRKIEILTGTVTTLAGIPGPVGTGGGTADGIGTAARFNLPNGITTDGANLYVTDLYQNTIRKLVLSTGAVSTIAGVPGTDGRGGSVDSPGTASFYNPVGITTDGSSLFVADSYNNTIRRVH